VATFAAALPAQGFSDTSELTIFDVVSGLSLKPFGHIQAAEA